MTRVSTALVSCVVLLTLSGSAVSARADTIRIQSGLITAGWGQVGDPWNSEGFYVDGGGLHVGTSMEDERGWAQLSVAPVVARGAMLDLSGTFTTLDPLGGDFNNSFVLISPFTMSFRASPTPLTCDTFGACSGSAPFTFRADMIFNPLDGQPFVEHLVGGGVARGWLDGSGPHASGAVEYDMTASPTPEPATLSLFAAGSLMAMCRRRKHS